MVEPDWVMDHKPSLSQKGCIVFEVQHPYHCPRLDAPYLSNSVCPSQLNVSANSTLSYTKGRWWNHLIYKPSHCFLLFMSVSCLFIFRYLHYTKIQAAVVISRTWSHEKNFHLQAVHHAGSVTSSSSTMHFTVFIFFG